MKEIIKQKNLLIINLIIAFVRPIAEKRLNNLQANSDIPAQSAQYWHVYFLCDRL